MLATAPGATVTPHLIGRSRCGMGGSQQGRGAYTFAGLQTPRKISQDGKAHAAQCTCDSCCGDWSYSAARRTPPQHWYQQLCRMLVLKPDS